MPSISDRLALALNIAEEARKVVMAQAISMSQAVTISQISPKEGKNAPHFINRQRILLEIILRAG